MDVKRWFRHMAVVVVLLMVLSPMASFYLTGGNVKAPLSHTTPPATRGGTLVIHGVFEINETTIDPITGERGKYGIDANLSVAQDGELRVVNAQIYFLQDVNNRYWMSVKGKLYMDNASITISQDLLHPYLGFNISFDGTIPGAYVRINNTRISYAGWFNVSNYRESDGDFFSLENTTFTSLSTTDDLFDDGPTPFFNSSDIRMINVRFESLFEHAPINNVFIGSAPSTNPPLPITVLNTSSVTTVADTYDISSITLTSDLVISQIGVTVTYTPGLLYDGTSNIVTYVKGVEMANDTLINGTGTQTYTVTIPLNTSGSNVLRLGDLAVAGNVEIRVTPPTQGNVTIETVSLDLYTSDTYGYYGRDRFNITSYNCNITGYNVFMNVDYRNLTSPADEGYHNVFAVYGGSIVRIVNLTANMTEVPADTNTERDPPVVVKDSSSAVYIYRHTVFRVTNPAGDPVDGVIINTTNTLSSSYDAENYRMWQFVREIGGEFSEVSVNGVAVMPLLSDILTLSEYPNSLYVGNYYYTATDPVTSALMTDATVTLPYFPLLSDEYGTKYVDVSVDVLNISVDSVAVSEPVVRGSTATITVNISVYYLDATNATLYINLTDGATTWNIATLTSQYYSVGTHSVTLNWNVPAAQAYGNYTVTAEVYDYYNGVKTLEVNYTDNSASTSIRIYPDVDLTGSISLSGGIGGKFVVGEPVIIYSNVTNLGSESAAGVKMTVVVEFGTTEVYRNTTFVTVAANSDYIWENRYSPTSEGTYTVVLTVEYYWDYDHGNNNASINFITGTAPNLKVTSMSADTNIFRHTNVTVTATIYSEEYTISGVAVNLYVRPVGTTSYGTLVDTTTVTLPSDTEVEVALTWTDTQNYDPGSYEFVVVVDPNNEYAESSETDNVMVQTFMLHYAIDYYVENVYYEVQGDLDKTTSAMQVEITVDVGVSGADADIAPEVYVTIEDANLGTTLYGATTENHVLTVTLTLSYTNVNVLRITVDSKNDYVELNENNNTEEVTISYPVFIAEVYPLGTLQILNGERGEIVVTITELRYMDAHNVNVVLEISGLSPMTYHLGNMSTGQSAEITFTVDSAVLAPFLNGANSVDFSYRVYITCDELGSNRYILRSDGTIRLIERPDLEVQNAMVVESDGAANDSKVAQNVPVVISFDIANTGGYTTGANVTYLVIVSLNGDEVARFTGSVEPISPGGTVHIEEDFTPAQIGIYFINITVDVDNVIQEKSEDNNEAGMTLTVHLPAVSVRVTVLNPQITLDDSVQIMISATNDNATAARSRNVGMGGYSLTVYIYADNEVVDQRTVTTGSDGTVTITYKPTTAGANYRIEVHYEDYRGSEVTEVENFVTVNPKPQEIDWLFVITIGAIAAVGAIMGLLLITSRGAVEKYAVCGSCNAIVPIDAPKCPKCGAVFEKEKAKCSVCGAWINIDAAYCPECGTIFITKEEEEYDYLTKMKEAYKKFLEKYAVEAKRDLGENYTEEDFIKWWQTHPEYISFEEWLKQEERKRREVKICPSCGAVNARDAMVCVSCGTDLRSIVPVVREEEAPAEEEEEAVEGEEKPAEEAEEAAGAEEAVAPPRPAEEEKPPAEGEEKPTEEAKPEERPSEEAALPPAEEAKPQEEAPPTEEKPEEEKPEEEKPEEKPPEEKKKPRRVQKKIVKKVVKIKK